MSTFRGSHSRPPEAPKTKTGFQHWRKLLILSGMIVVMVGVMLAARPAGVPLPWDSDLNDSGRAGQATDVVPLPLPGPGLATTPVDPNEAPVGQAGVSGGSSGTGAGSPDSASGGESSGDASSGNEGDSLTDPPAEAEQPEAPEQPEAKLDSIFGVSMFSATVPGMKQVQVFDVDDDEITVTYKSAGEAGFELLRLTVVRTESARSADEHLEALATAIHGRRTTYTWGDRNILQVSSDGESTGAPVGFLWRQGRYAIDAIVYSPYPKGPAAAWDEALDFIGRLEY